MDNILDLFETVEITNKNAISEEDRKFCETQFGFYKKVYEAYKKHLKIVADLTKEQAEVKKEIESYNVYSHTYINTYGDIGESNTKKSMISLTKEFAYSICEYFNKKYFVTTTSKELFIDEYAREPVFFTLDEVLDKCILNSLDGLSFIEKAIEEIKTKARTERSYSDWRKEWNYEIKGKIIKFRFNIYNIMPALYFYDNGEKEIVSAYTYNKIDDYRSFENGNTDIKFYKTEYALEFARKYLGYVSA